MKHYRVTTHYIMFIKLVELSDDDDFVILLVLVWVIIGNLLISNNNKNNFIYIAPLKQCLQSAPQRVKAKQVE